MPSTNYEGKMAEKTEGAAASDFSHRGEALWEMDKAKAEESPDWAMRRFAAAQAHASLAIAEQLERLNDQLGGLDEAVERGVWNGIANERAARR